MTFRGCNLPWGQWKQFCRRQILQLCCRVLFTLLVLSLLLCVYVHVCVCEPWAWGHHQWKHFLRYWPFVLGIHRSPVNSPHKGQWRGALMFSLICAWINAWVNNREAGDLRCHYIHYDVTVMDCPHDNSSPILRYNHQIRTKMQNTLVKIPIVMEIDWPRPLMSMLT